VVVLSLKIPPHLKCVATLPCEISVSSKQQLKTIGLLQQHMYSLNSTWLATSRHDTTRHVRRVESMHFGCVELVEQHGSTRSTRWTRWIRRARQLSLLYNLYKSNDM